MKNADKKAQPAKLEEILSQEEQAKKEAAKKLRDLKQQQKGTDQNDFVAMMSMAATISDTQDTKKKLTKAAARNKREALSGTMNQTTKSTANLKQKDPFASLYD